MYLNLFTALQLFSAHCAHDHVSLLICNLYFSSRSLYAELACSPLQQAFLHLRPVQENQELRSFICAIWSLVPCSRSNENKWVTYRWSTTGTSPVGQFHLVKPGAFWPSPCWCHESWCHAAGLDLISHKSDLINITCLLSFLTLTVTINYKKNNFMSYASRLATSDFTHKLTRKLFTKSVFLLTLMPLEVCL